MSPIEIVLLVAGVGYILTRRLLGEQLEMKRLLLIPVILTVVGVSSLQHLHPANATTVAFIGAGIALSVVLGLVRGITVQLAERDGVLWMRYRVSTVLLWVLNIGGKLALYPVEHAISPASASAANSGITVAIGLGILAETAVVLLRGLRSGSALTWQKGKPGQPDRLAPSIDDLRGRFAGQWDQPKQPPVDRW